MGRIIAIDYGRKRVGIAVTDPLKIAANALATVPLHDVMSYLKDYISTEKVEKIIVGHPTQMDGQDSDSMQYITPFVNWLRKQFPEIDVVFVDERFTSLLAQRTMLEAGLKKKARQDKALVDRIAATIILQTYLETNL